MPQKKQTDPDMNVTKHQPWNTNLCAPEDTAEALECSDTQ